MVETNDLELIPVFYSTEERSFPSQTFTQAEQIPDAYLSVNEAAQAILAHMRTNEFDGINDSTLISPSVDKILAQLTESKKLTDKLITAVSAARAYSLETSDFLPEDMDTRYLINSRDSEGYHLVNILAILIRMQPANNYMKTIRKLTINKIEEELCNLILAGFLPTIYYQPTTAYRRNCQAMFLKFSCDREFVVTDCKAHGRQDMTNVNLGKYELTIMVPSVATVLLGIKEYFFANHTQEWNWLTVESRCHPHAGGHGRMCLGKAFPLFDTCIFNGRFLDALDIGCAVLNGCDNEHAYVNIVYFYRTINERRQKQQQEEEARQRAEQERLERLRPTQITFTNLEVTRDVQETQEQDSGPAVGWIQERD